MWDGRYNNHHAIDSYPAAKMLPKDHIFRGKNWAPKWFAKRIHSRKSRFYLKRELRKETQEWK